MKPTLADPDAKPSLRQPFALGLQDWRSVWRDAVHASGRHSLGLISAGVAFFGLLALFPALAATVALFGLVGDPKDVGSLIEGLRFYAPASVLDIAREQMVRLLHADDQKLALHGGVSLMVALWSAQQGARSFLRALTIVNERGRRRGFVGRYVAGGAITLAALLVAVVTVFAFALAPAIFAQIGANSELLLTLLRPPALVVLITGFAMALYRWGPARRPPAWRWVWPGAVAAAVTWLIVTIGFKTYVDVLTPLRAAYGVFSGVFVLMLWLFLSAYIFLMGAEINAQLERVCAGQRSGGAEAPQPQPGTTKALPVETSPLSDA